MSIIRCLLPVFLCALTAPLSAQHLLKDLSPGSDPGAGCNPSEMAVIGDTLVFTAFRGKYELWASPVAKSEPRMLANWPRPEWKKDEYGDTLTGQPAWYPSQFTVMGGKLYFVAASGGSGQELWVTDGTQTGTRCVVAYNETGYGGVVTMLHPCGDRLFFVSQSDNFPGAALFYTDGTKEGTHVASQLDFAELDRIQGRVAVDGRRVWYAAMNMEFRTEVRYFDPETEKEVAVANLDITDVLGFWVVEGRVFYTSGSDPKKAQCWTFTEKDPAPVLLAESSREFSMITAPAYHNGAWWLVWFKDSSWSLVSSDGTKEGTKARAELSFGFADLWGSQKPGFVRLAGETVLACPSMGGKSGLWSLGGDEPKLLWASPDREFVYLHDEDRLYAFGREPKAGASHSGWAVTAKDGKLAFTENFEKLDYDRYRPFHGCNGRQVFFRADRDGSGPEVFRVSGDKFELFIDLVRKPQSSTLSPMVQAAGGTWFCASAGKGRCDLFLTDGTPDGTQQVIEHFADYLATPRLFRFEADGPWYFFGPGQDEKLAALQLWTTDGTAKGTRRVSAFPTNAAPTGLVWKLGDRYVWTVVTARDNWGYALVSLASAGLDGANVQVLNGDIGEDGYSPGGWASTFPIGNRILWRHKSALWASDGTREGTGSLKEVWKGSIYDRQIMYSEVAEAAVFITAVDGKWSIWRTDGTAEGTLELLNTGIEYKHSDRPMILGDEHQVFIRMLKYASNSAATSWLWRTDGTAEGTRELRKIELTKKRDYDPIDGIQPIAMINGKLAMACISAEHGAEPWLSDGTVEGTRLWKDVNKGNADWYGRQQTVVGDRLFAICSMWDTKQEGLVAFDTDSGDATTLISCARNTGTAFSSEGRLMAWQERLVVAGPSSAGLWITDGTGEGTVQLLKPESFKGGSVVLAAAKGGFFALVRDAEQLNIWFSDGTPEGTRCVAERVRVRNYTSPVPVRIDDRLLIPVSQPGKDRTDDWWWSDGTVAGTVLARAGVPSETRVLGTAGGVALLAWAFEGIGTELARFGSNDPGLQLTAAGTLTTGEASAALADAVLELDDAGLIGGGQVVLSLSGAGASWSCADGNTGKGLEMRKEDWRTTSFYVDGRLVATAAGNELSGDTLRLAIQDGTTPDDMKQLLLGLRVKAKNSGSFELQVGIGDGHGGCTKAQVSLEVK
ncbi:MAG: hypothetical protein H6841_06370 [Planctomycetes bacterium]|nr:hypothetical protein [Planctomycetota bacterium]MCB9936052.1 hypothetical protein [Planctomycetota bacterium]